MFGCRVVTQAAVGVAGGRLACGERWEFAVSEATP